MTAILDDLACQPVLQHDRAAFLAAYGHLFEHSPWVLERAWDRRPFRDAASLLDACLKQVAEADEAEQRALIRAHPELADKFAVAEGLTQSSAEEQASAGLDRLTAEQHATLSSLNRAYRARFDFPFIICVKLNTRETIEAALRQRLGNDPAAEFTEALRQIGLIAHMRLAALLPPTAESAEAAHSARVAHDLDMLNLPHDWLPAERTDSGEAILDVAIVGGGQCGLAAAFGLIREGVRNILVLDENRAGAEGPWATYARMITLRTPKQLTPIDFGIPSLTFRAWWEAQYGRGGWDRVDKIPKEEWMRYLRWYRRTLGLPVLNDARVTAIEPCGDARHRLTIERPQGIETRIARKIVLATGIQGGGEWHVPDFIKHALPRERYAHTADPIDFTKLQGKRIGILGGGASAFDNAQHGLEMGVGSVDLFIRREQLPRINPIRYMEQSGLLKNFPLLDDQRKYRVIDHFLRLNQPPTNDTFRRASRFANFHLHLGAGWSEVYEQDGEVRVRTPKGEFGLDFLILSTGTRNDLQLRPELSAYRDEIALWRDRYTPTPGTENPQLDAHPYLGPSFEVTPSNDAAAAKLHGLFVFNYSALASLGLSASALSGLKPALTRLVSGVVGQLFLDRQDRLVGAYLDYAEEEFLGP